MKETWNIGRWIATGLGVTLFLASLPLPAFYHHYPRLGIEALLFGWLALISGQNLSWIGNVFWLLSIVMLCTMDRRRLWVASLTAGVGFLCSLHIFFYRRVLLDARGIEIHIEEFGSGYFLWVASFLYVIVAGCILWFVARHTVGANHPIQPSGEVG